MALELSVGQSLYGKLDNDIDLDRQEKLSKDIPRGSSRTKLSVMIDEAMRRNFLFAQILLPKEIDPLGIITPTDKRDAFVREHGDSTHKHLITANVPDPSRTSAIAQAALKGFVVSSRHTGLKARMDNPRSPTAVDIYWRVAPINHREFGEIKVGKLITGEHIIDTLGLQRYDAHEPGPMTNPVLTLPNGEVIPIIDSNTVVLIFDMMALAKARGPQFFLDGPWASFLYALKDNFKLHPYLPSYDGQPLPSRPYALEILNAMLQRVHVTAPGFEPNEVMRSWFKEVAAGGMTPIEIIDQILNEATSGGLPTYQYMILINNVGKMTGEQRKKFDELNRKIRETISGNID